MACEARHKAQTITEGLHSAISFEYADESARLAGGPFESFDKYKLALQTDDNSVWLLVDEVAETWVQVTVTSSNIDHGSISGLLDDDHPQYLLVDGTRAMSGDLDMDGYDILNVGLIDGVDILNHASRHEFGGADAIELSNIGTSETDTTLVLKPDGAGGVSWVVDQVRDLDGYVFENRQLIAGDGLTGGGDLSADRTFNVVANADGSIVVNANDIQVGVLATDAQHGNRGGGSLHAVATTSVAGFMSASDKTKLDGIDAATTITISDATAGVVGTNTTYAREDHKHQVDTTGTLSIIDAGDTASDGTASGLARKDHQHAVSTGTASTISVGDTASEGTSTNLARADHGHTLTAGTPVAIGNANATGSSGNFVHSDHVHQLGGTVGGDLSGTLPNPTVVDLTISGEQQGSVLYFDGTNWVQLPPGTDGYVLSTQGVGADPQWVDVDSVGAGDVIGPASSTDNALVRFDGTSGKFIQNSNAILTDAGALTLTLGLTTGGGIDVGGNNITNVNLVDGVDVSSHADRHEFGGADQIDGYELELTYSAINYNQPTNDKLGEHIAAIDDALVSLDTSLTNVYYVDQNGNDVTGDGSISNPFATVSQAMTAIGDASTTLEYEDYNLTTFVVWIGPGSYTENVTIPRRQYINLRFQGAVEIVGDITYTADTSLGRSSHPPRLTLTGNTNRPGFGTAVQTIGVRGNINFGDSSSTSYVAILDLDHVYITGDIICDGNSPPHLQIYGDNANIQGGIYHAVGFTARVQLYIQGSPDSGSLSGFGSLGLVGRANHFRFRSLDGISIPGNVEADGSSGDGRLTNVEFGGTINFNGSTATLDMDLVTYNSYITALSGTDTGTVNILDAHASYHESGGVDEIDGYQIALVYTPTNYDTPSSDLIGQHLFEIDQELGVISGSVVTDHGGLSGLLDDDHPQYLLIDGTRAMSGNLDMGSNNITNVNLVDGVDVSSHGTRHDPGGADPVTTAAATGLDADSTNTEGTATSLARSDHTHAIDTTGTLSTIDAGDTSSDGVSSGLARKDHQHGVSTGAASAISVGDTASEGVSTDLARADHGHTLTAAAPVAIGDSNQIGSSGNFVHSDHVHQLGGTVGGDLSGALPNPTVTDLTITGEEQGSVLYFDGTNWVQLPPGEDGYALITKGTGADPEWGEVVTSSVKRTVTVEFTLTEDVNNTTQWFTTWRSHGGDSPGNKRSGTTVGIQNQNTCSPYQVPFDATIIKAILTLKGAGVQNGSVSYPVTYQTDLYEEGFTSETKINDIDFSISNSFTVGTFSPANTHYTGSVDLNIDVDEAQLLALKFINGTGASLVGQSRNAFITLILEER